MAATKKSLEIRTTKQNLAEQIKNIRWRIRVACSGKIPERVMAMDAATTVEWRDTAEAALAYVTAHPKANISSNSTKQLEEILMRDTMTLQQLV